MWGIEGGDGLVVSIFDSWSGDLAWPMNMGARFHLPLLFDNRPHRDHVPRSEFSLAMLLLLDRVSYKDYQDIARLYGENQDKNP